MLHAAKNGFFYVIDRENGKLISAEKLGTVTWADRVDLVTGKPVLAPGAKYEEKNILLWPSFQAVHHWTPQSYSPKTGLVYEPTLEMPAEFGDAGVDISNFSPLVNTPEFTGLSLGSGDVPADAGRSVLKAWDPIAKRVVWQVETPGISNGGTLATAGNLVFEGLADGYFHAYSAQMGRTCGPGSPARTRACRSPTASTAVSTRRSRPVRWADRPPGLARFPRWG
jgi:quinohemoprotein ethanol dehydrogenase